MLQSRKLLEVINYNKALQNKLNINIDDYKDYYKKHSKIEIELIPDTYGKFINIPKEEESYYHIYFNDDKDEIKRNYTERTEIIKKIKIIIDDQVESFCKLFEDCRCIKSINFKKFNRININNMSYLFSNCSSMTKLNVSNFVTNNVTNMSNMFYGCSSLKNINLSKFNTGMVKDMSWMFFGCSSLKELNISNFNTDNVSDMSLMFRGCI